MSSALVTALSYAGLGMSVGSQVIGGISAYGEGKEQAAVATANAKLAEAQAKNQAAQEREKYRRLSSSQTAAYGASGIDVNTGSPLDMLAATDAEGEVSAMQLLYSGELDAANYKRQARAAKSQGSSGLVSGVLGGIGSGLYGMQKLGLFAKKTE